MDKRGQAICVRAVRQGRMSNSERLRGGGCGLREGFLPINGQARAGDLCEGSASRKDEQQ
jgi:hypothetical protein